MRRRAGAHCGSTFATLDGSRYNVLGCASYNVRREVPNDDQAILEQKVNVRRRGVGDRNGNWARRLLRLEESYGFAHVAASAGHDLRAVVG